VKGDIAIGGAIKGDAGIPEIGLLTDMRRACQDRRE
jgi:hypothetical protein